MADQSAAPAESASPTKISSSPNSPPRRNYKQILKEKRKARGMHRESDEDEPEEELGEGQVNVLLSRRHAHR